MKRSICSLIFLNAILLWWSVMCNFNADISMILLPSHFRARMMQFGNDHHSSRFACAAEPNSDNEEQEQNQEGRTRRSNNQRIQTNVLANPGPSTFRSPRVPANENEQDFVYVPLFCGSRLQRGTELNYVGYYNKQKEQAERALAVLEKRRSSLQTVYTRYITALRELRKRQSIEIQRNYDFIHNKLAEMSRSTNDLLRKLPKCKPKDSKLRLCVANTKSIDEYLKDFGELLETWLDENISREVSIQQKTAQLARSVRRIIRQGHAGTALINAYKSLIEAFSKTD